MLLPAAGSCMLCNVYLRALGGLDAGGTLWFDWMIHARGLDADGDSLLPASMT